MRTRALACIALATLVSIASAGEPPRYGFECDTPAGHYSFWNRSVSTSTIDVVGKVTVNELRQDERWLPSLRIGFEDANTSSGIHLLAYPGVPEVYMVEVSKPGDKERYALGTIARTKEPIAFELRLDAGKKLHVSLGGLEADIPLGQLKPTQFQLSCSTGDFEFTEVAVEEHATK